PSGAAFATASVPSTPPWPPRLSISTGCLAISDMRWPITRAMMSLGPPAGNGTISLIGFAGKSCAEAKAGNNTGNDSSVSPANSPLRSLMNTPRSRICCACSKASYAMNCSMQGPRWWRRELRASHQEFVRMREPDRSLRDQIAPDPVVVTNDARGVEVRPIIQGVGVHYHDDIVMV